MKEELKQFVLHHYQTGKLDTRQALRNVKARVGLKNDRPTHGGLSVRFYRWMAAAAMLSFICGATYLYITRENAEVKLTADDAVKTITLPDSTHVTLAPHATLAYNPQEPRSVRLTGDAYFNVTHSEATPFTVVNSIAQVTVLGTQFQIDEEAGQTTIYVAQGRVRFGNIGLTQAIVLGAGEKALIGKRQQQPEHAPSGSPNQTAWATGQMHFEDTPLTDVLADLGFYYHANLRCNHPERRLSADFHVAKDSLEEIIALIEQTLDVNISIEKTEKQ